MWSPPRERPAQPPGAYAVVTVEDLAGRFKDYAISRDTAGRGVSIGSDPECDVRLSGRKVRPVHARLDPKSNHWVITYLPNGAPLPLQETDDQHDDRVDRAPFQIEGHVLQIHDSYVW